MKLVAPATAGQTVAPCSFGLVFGSTLGRPSAAISFAQVVLANGFAEEHLPRLAIEHVEEAVTVGVQDDLPLLAPDHDVGEHGHMRRVVVPYVVRGELVVPPELPGIRVSATKEAV